MILAYHLIFSAYGFWLPNDPRGSWSDYVRAYELWKFGPATKTTTRSSVAHIPHDRAAREAAKAALKYPPVTFTGRQALAIAKGFAFRARRSNIAIHACAILPDHAHLLVGRIEKPIEQVANLLKGAASYQMRALGVHPFQDRPMPDGSLPSPWAQDFWKVYVDTVEHVELAIAYIHHNPPKAGLREQRWAFVTPYAG